MIAHQCGISKRTLYEQFTDKATLISEVINYSHAQQLQVMEQIFKESSNCLEALLKIYQRNVEFMNNTSPALTRDMQRFYPQLHKVRQDQAMANIKSFADVISQGIQQGVFRDDVDAMIVSTLFHSSMKAIHDNRLFADRDPKTIMHQGFINFLRGLATRRGLDIIDEFLQKLS